MRIIHLSDLHIGKRVFEFSLIEDQAYILNQITEIVKNQNADAVIIAGDVYDRSVPPVEAITLFNTFLNQLNQLDVEVFIIGGNHDAQERLSFGANLLSYAKIHITEAYQGKVEYITLEHEGLKYRFYLLPFVKPVQVRPFFEETIENYQDAMKYIIDQIELDQSYQNILVAHQFVLGADTSDSEELSVGGLDQIDAKLFTDFDYVALGHLHKPQKVLKETIRYAGSPLKYSFSEMNGSKSIVQIDFVDNHQVQIELIPLKPIRDLALIKGFYHDIVEKSYYEGIDCNQYFQVILLDEEDIPEVLGKLRSIYPNIMQISYQNERTMQTNVIDQLSIVEQMSPLDLFEKLYELQNNVKLDDSKKKYLVDLIDELWGEQS